MEKELPTDDRYRTCSYVSWPGQWKKNKQPDREKERKGPLRGLQCTLIYTLAVCCCLLVPLCL